MPVYDYRCNHCGRQAALFYKSYKDYDRATHTCPHCGSTDMTRLISRVAIAKPGKDYANMTSNEMLSVLEGGNTGEVGQMMRDLGQDESALAQTYNEVTQQIAKPDPPPATSKAE
jgi:putative FmdB family regulatory protein